MVKLADTRDSKSRFPWEVRVQVPPPALMELTPEILAKYFYKVSSYHCDFHENVMFISDYEANNFELKVTEEYNHYQDFIKEFSSSQLTFDNLNKLRKTFKQFALKYDDKKKIHLDRACYIYDTPDCQYKLKSRYVTYGYGHAATLWAVYKDDNLIISTFTKNKALYLLILMLKTNKFIPVLESGQFINYEF